MYRMLAKLLFALSIRESFVFCLLSEVGSKIMAWVKSTPPTPNKNNEYHIDVSLSTDGKYIVYDISSYLPIYNGRDRDNRMATVRHVVAGKTATVYITDHYEILNRQSAIKLAGRFVSGDFNTYRLD